MRIDLKTGFGCNNRCRFCVQGDRRRHHPDRSTDELRALLETSREHGDELVLTGGECTIRPDLPELVRHARALGFRVIQIQTNGRTLSRPATCDSLIEAGATEFSPALHGATPARHDALTRAPGSFRQTVRGILNLVERGQVVITNSVVTRPNLDELPTLGVLLTALGVHQYQFAMVHPLGSANLNFDKIVPRLEEAAPYVRAGLAPGRRAGRRVMVEAMPACLMAGWEDTLAEAYIPPTRIEDVGSVVADYARSRVGEGKAKGPDCAACTWTSRCEGPWREYPERHGWTALRPRTDPLLGAA